MSIALIVVIVLLFITLVSIFDIIQESNVTQKLAPFCHENNERHKWVYDNEDRIECSKCSYAPWRNYEI